MAIVIDFNNVKAAITPLEPERNVVCGEHESTDLLHKLHIVALMLRHGVALCDEGLYGVGLI